MKGSIIVGFLLVGAAFGMPGGWLEYPIYEGDPEYEFTMDAINFLRSNCNLSKFAAENFTIYDDECFAFVAENAKQILVSVEIDEGDTPSNYLALISTEETVGDISSENETSSDKMLQGNFSFLALFESDGETEKKFCGSSSRRSMSNSYPTLISKTPKQKPQPRFVVTPTVSDDDFNKIPQEWDWRANMPSELNYSSKAAASVALSQGSCGSCYTFGGISALAYRFNIASKGKINAVPSPQSVMTCANGCEGGFFEYVYNALKSSKIAADWAVPYTGKVAGTCPTSGSGSMLYKTKDFTDSQATGDQSPHTKRVLGWKAMMWEVWNNGPAGVYVKADDQFGSYSVGVLEDKKCTKGAGDVCQFTTDNLDHACTLVGWGTENGKNYWLIQNSWGPGWGQEGFMKLERGKNALGVETDGAIVASVDLSDACPDKPACLNGGSYTDSCGCHCIGPWSGDVCSICSKTCTETENFDGTPGDKCTCACKNGYTNPTNLLGFSDCNLRALIYPAIDESMAYSSVVKVNGPGSVKFLFGIYNDSSEITAANKVKKGDMLVAVDVGKKPWTKEADWGTTKFRANICGAKDWDKEAGAGIPCGTSMDGQIQLTTEGIYDIYYVKYNGISEFGVDKGYGKDFMQLRQQVCTYTDATKCENVTMVAEQNRAAQQAQLANLAAAAAAADTAVRQKSRDAAAAKEAARIAKDKDRTVIVSFVLAGVSSEYFGKDERKVVESALSTTLGASCGDAGAMVPRNCTSRDVKIIGITAPPTTRRAKQNPGPGSASVAANITVLNSTVAAAASSSISTAMKSGAFTAALKTLGSNTFLSFVTGVNNTSPVPGATAAVASTSVGGGGGGGGSGTSTTKAPSTTPPFSGVERNVPHGVWVLAALSLAVVIERLHL